ncbi:MAG: YesL family protein [Butyricicoccus sp.]|nr:YesL family protein [Butyricicoccus sp.]
MGGFFSSNNILFRASERIMDVCVLSLMWLLCSLPALTFVPASSALYYSCVKCLRRGEKGPYVNFLRAFRDNLKTGIAASAVFLLLGAVLAWLNFMLAQLAPPAARIAYLVLMLLPIGALTCTSALLSRFSCSLGSLLRDAARITIGHLPRVAAAAALNVLTALICVRYALFLVWIFLPATDALLLSRLLEPVLKKYTPGYEEYVDVPIEERPWYFR